MPAALHAEHPGAKVERYYVDAPLHDSAEGATYVVYRIAQRKDDDSLHRLARAFTSHGVELREEPKVAHRA